MKPRVLIPVVTALMLVASACDNGEAELSTTSSLVLGTTEAPDPGATTTVPDGGEATPTTLRGEPVTDHEVIIRESTDDGLILHIVIPPGAYTEVDMQNFVGDLLEGNPELWGAEIFDDRAALDAYQKSEDERTEEEQRLIDEHHFVSLVRGDTLRFQGPFSEFGEHIIGS